MRRAATDAGATPSEPYDGPDAQLIPARPIVTIGATRGRPLLADVVRSELTRLMTTLLYQVNATDPGTFGLVAALLAFVAFLANYLPARRATRIDPLAALRHE